jgi:hypothetical protein
MSGGGLSTEVPERIIRANHVAALALAQERGVTPDGDVMLPPSSPLRVSLAAPTAVAALGGREEKLVGADLR